MKVMTSLFIFVRRQGIKKKERKVAPYNSHSHVNQQLARLVQLQTQVLRLPAPDTTQDQSSK